VSNLDFNGVGRWKRALAGPHGHEQIPELAERSKQRVKNFYADLNMRLSEVSFVARDTFSAGRRQSQGLWPDGWGTDPLHRDGAE
jgi:hypothetical protein